VFELEGGQRRARVFVGVKAALVVGFVTDLGLGDGLPEFAKAFFHNVLLSKYSWLKAYV
jgi:hypothetical protein